jgi:hypothetical protein
LARHSFSDGGCALRLFFVGLPGAIQSGSTILKTHFPPMLKQTFFFSPTVVLTSSPTEAPGILDLSFTFRAIPYPLRYIKKYDGKDILFLTEKSKRPDKIWQDVAGKDGI